MDDDESAIKAEIQFYLARFAEIRKLNKEMIRISKDESAYFVGPYLMGIVHHNITNK